jgi:DNA-binding NarL/FixJ family response regulator
MAVLLVSHDLLWMGKVRAVAGKLGVEVLVPMRKTDITQMLLDGETTLVLVDLHDPKFDFVETIRLVKGTRWDARMVCFGHHTDEATLERARAAGAKDVMSNGQLDRELAALVAASKA